MPHSWRLSGGAARFARIATQTKTGSDKVMRSERRVTASTGAASGTA